MEVTTYKDYIDKVYEEFSEVDEASIRTIVRYGLGVMSIYKRLGLDIWIHSPSSDQYYFCGDAHHGYTKDYEKQIGKKLRRKTRLMYKMRKEPYDGYFYFSLTKEQYTKWLANEEQEIITYKVAKEPTNYKPALYHFKIAREETRIWSERRMQSTLKDAIRIEELKK